MHCLPSLTVGTLPLPRGPELRALEDRLQQLFSRHGRVQRLDLVRADQAQARRVLCFLRMSSPQEERAVADALGLGRFGGDLVMVLTLDDTEPVPEATPPPWSAPGPGAPIQPGWR